MGATNKFLFCYLPTLLLLGSVFFILSIHQQKCHNIDCHFNCMNTGSKTVLECIHECKCMLAALPFWLTHFPPAFEPFEVSQVSKSECTGETASTPKLAQLPSHKQPFKKKPNFVVVLLDDQDEVISPYFDAMPFAKQLFQTNGTKFENSFASTALCCPARCQLLTGLYAHNTGVYANVGEYGARRGFVEPLDEAGHRLKDENGKCINHEKRTIAAMLRQNGNYATGIFGKYLNGIEYGGDWYLPPGWSDFSAGGDHGLYTGYYYSLYNYREGQKEDVSFSWYNFGPEDYMTDVVRDRTVDFIHRYRFNVTDDNKRPLFMYVSSTAPHFPLPPAERHKQYLDYWDKKYESIVTSRPNFYNDSDVATKSAWLRNTAALRKTWREHPFLRTDFVKRMASLYSVDEMIQSIHEKLKQQGELDNTVWVLTSDNGYNLGSHHLIHKMAPYEESTRIPFYVSGPGFPKGKVSKDLVLIQDITPTLLNLAGYETPSYMDGFSLVPGKGNSSAVEIPNKRNAVLFEYKAPIAWYYNVTLPMEIFPLFRANYDPGFALDIPPYKAIRTKDHMLVDYFYFEPNVREATRHEFELYDMKQDPYQLNNIYKKVGGDNSSLVQELYGKMQKLRYCKGKECNI